MKISVLTSLYPSPTRPFEGVFAERRWLGMLERGHEIRVTNPVPLAPGPFLFGKWAEIAKMPRQEDRGGIPVARPRYFHVPGRVRQNARRFSKVGVRRILGGGRPDVVVVDYAWPAAVAALRLRELGIPHDNAGVFLMVGSKNLPGPVVKTLSAAIKEATEDPEVRGLIDKKLGLVTTFNGPDALAKFIAAKTAEAKSLVAKK